MPEPRTFVIGDLHGDIEALRVVLGRLPRLGAYDTLVFLGDYLDRGPDSAAVIDLVRRELPRSTPARVVALRGNHEDAWLRVVDHGWPEFVLPPGNGCAAALRSFVGRDPTADDLRAMYSGAFLPAEVVAWMRALPYWYEDEHAIYVHAGLPLQDGAFPHPADVREKASLLWSRSRSFFLNYRGKLVICGHTTTDLLPQELSHYTPDDPDDLWAGDAVWAIDTGAGKGGFLTAVELPGRVVYESR